MMRCARYQLLIVAAVLLIPAFAAAANPQRNEAEIRQRLKQVFARPEFSLQDRSFWEWLREQVARLFAWLGGLRDVNPVLFWLLLVGCLVLLLLLGIQIGWTVRRALTAAGLSEAVTFGIVEAKSVACDAVMRISRQRSNMVWSSCVAVFAES